MITVTLATRTIEATDKELELLQEQEQQQTKIRSCLEATTNTTCGINQNGLVETKNTTGSANQNGKQNGETLPVVIHLALNPKLPQLGNKSKTT